MSISFNQVLQGKQQLYFGVSGIAIFEPQFGYKPKCVSRGKEREFIKTKMTGGKLSKGLHNLL